MQALLIALLCLIVIPPIIAWIDFLIYLASGDRFAGNYSRIFEALLMGYALFFLVSDLGFTNDCCTDSAVFSPNHRLSVIVLTLLSVVAFFYSTYRKRLATPILEIIVNCLLLSGLALDIAIAIQE